VRIRIAMIKVGRCRNQEFENFDCGRVATTSHEREQIAKTGRSEAYFRAE